MSTSPQGALHLLMVRSVPQGESELSVDRVRVPGVELAIQEGSNPVRECIRKPPSDERWVSDDGDTNHFTRYSSNLYDLVMILPGKERVLIGDGKAMRETGVGSLNFKMHSKTDFNVTLTGVYVAEGIGFNHSCLLYTSPSPRD